MGSCVCRANTCLLAFFCAIVCAPLWSQTNVSDLVKPRITQAVNETQLTRLRGNTHPLARAEFDRGAAPADLPLKRMLLVLQRSPEQESALRTLLDQQQDKSSPNYHRWLTPAEFGSKFGAAEQDIEIVTNWLRGHGFEVARVSKGRTVIEFSGTAGQVQEAFHTAIHKYVVHGEEHWANSSDPQIPMALSSVVAGVHTLHNFRPKPLLRISGIYSRSKATGQVTAVEPLFTFPGGCDKNGNCYALGPYDFAAIYNVLSLWNASPTAIDGTGQTIAVVGETNINLQDVQDFRTLFGLPPITVNNPNVIVNGPDPGILTDGEETEADLDVEWSGAVAKGATIDFVVSESTETTAGIDLSAEYIIDQNLAPVLSESYGSCELAIGTAGNQFYNTIWSQAAAQGITVILASGDSGAAGCDGASQVAHFGLAVSGFASTPFNVAVGGTDFDDFSNASTYWNPTNDVTQASARGYIPETTWNDTCTNGIFATFQGFTTNAETNCNNAKLAPFLTPIGGGGGASNCTTNNQQPGTCSGGYPKPAWQHGKGVPADGLRDVPDVSLFASNGFVGNFTIVCQSDATSGSCDLNAPYAHFVGVGGTSAAAPALAGIMALVNQEMASQGLGQAEGNANYVFYKLAQAQQGMNCNSSTGSGQNCIFNDVTSGTISLPCTSGSPNCTTQVAGDAYGVLSGYNAGPGYDLATGLGSVNANNLVHNWTLASFTSTTTTVVAPNAPVAITHGQPLTVTVNVAPSAATGNVALIGVRADSTTFGIDGHALAGGAVTWSTNLLPGGSYNLRANYGGDGTYAASESSAPGIPVVVSAEGSKMTLRVVTFDLMGNITNQNATTTPYGSPYILRADVTNSAGASCGALGGGCPTGTVTLTDNSSPLDKGMYSLNNLGYAEDHSIQLPASPTPHMLQATYSGDASFSAIATPVTDSVTITQAATTTAAAATGLPKGATLTATIATSSNGNPPTGTVTFSLNGTAIGSPVAVSGVAAKTDPQTGAFIGAQGIATFPDTQLANGTYTLNASYTGDSNYAASSTQMTIKVQPDFILSASTNVINIPAAGQSGSLSLMVAANDGFTGTVQFSCLGLPAESTCSFSPASLTGSGNTNLTVTTTGPHVVAQLTPVNDLHGWYGSGLMLLAGIFLAGSPNRKTRWRHLALLLVLACLLSIIGCGGGGGNSHLAPHNDPGTPSGSYNVIVTATSGSLSHNVSFTLITP